VFVTLRSLVVPPAVLLPSTITKSAPDNRRIAVVEEPVIVDDTPVAGLMVSVLVALEEGLALMVIGNVSAAL
jgi:hypothetical protein